MCKCACRHCRCDCHTLEDAIAGPLADHLWRDYKATEIADAVAEHYTITTAQITGPSRKGKVARARQVAMFLIREKLKWSYPAIGLFFQRDHTTIMHGHRKQRKIISIREIELIRQKLHFRLYISPSLPALPADFYFDPTDKAAAA